MGKIIIEEVLSSKKNWKDEFDEKYDYIKQHIGEDGCFDRTIKFKFYKSDNITQSLYISDYITNLILWRPFIKFKRHYDETMLFDCSNITKTSIKRYIDIQIVKKYSKKYPIRLLNLECAKIIERLKAIVEDFGLIMALSLDIFDTIDLMDKCPEYKEILHTDLPPMLQPSEVEAYIKEKSKRMVEIATSNDCQLKTFLDSKEGIKIDQLNEFQLSEGMKPDLHGNTFPFPINTNLYVKGLDKPSHYTLDAAGGRKAQIMNKKYTGESGYFARQLDYACLDIHLHKDADYDCGTKNLLKIKVKSHAMLESLRSTYYRKKPNSKVTRILDPDEDTHLIGETIYIRNPLTCASKKGICHKCYGALSYINKDIHIGLFAAKEISSRFTQIILSAKHLLKTNSIKLEMNKEFNDYFVLDGGSIMLNPFTEKKISKTYIKINSDDIKTDNEFDEGEGEMKINSFKILKGKENPITIMTVREKKNNEMYITEYLQDLIKKYQYSSEKDILIPLNKIDDSETLFVMSVMNHELTKPLKDLTKLINSKDHLGCETVKEMVDKLFELFMDIGFEILFVHGLVLIRNIVRSSEDESVLPDYSVLLNEDDLCMTTIKSSAINDKSVIKSISFERMEEQFRKPKTFQKTSASMLDALFKIRRDV